MDKNGAGFVYLKHKFPTLSDAKIKEVIFAGPKIRQLIKYGQFEEQLNEAGKAARQAFKNITKSFFGKSQGRKLS
jgi:ribosomal 50S subunit-associated protein YjgA (DUF615 family)